MNEISLHFASTPLFECYFSTLKSFVLCCFYMTSNISLSLTRDVNFSVLFFQYGVVIDNQIFKSHSFIVPKTIWFYFEFQTNIFCIDLHGSREVLKFQKF